MLQPDSFNPQSSNPTARGPESTEPVATGPAAPEPVTLPTESAGPAIFNGPQNSAFSPPAEEKPVKAGIWGGWPTIGLGIAIFSVNGFVQVLVMLIFGIFMALDGLTFTDPYDVQRLMQNLLGDGLMLSMAIIFSSLAGIAVTLLFIKVRRGDSISQYLALKAISWKTVLLMVGIYAVMLGISLGLGALVQSSSNGDIFSDAYHNTQWPVLFWLALVVFGPFFEEFLFRGFLFAGLKGTRLGISGTIVVTGLVFALLHAAQYGAAVIAQIFVLGIVFGLVRWRTGSLWSTILLHALWNCGQMVVMTFWPALGG
jgi:uncharacterized protein